MSTPTLIVAVLLALAVIATSPNNDPASPLYGPWQDVVRFFYVSAGLALGLRAFRWARHRNAPAATEPEK